VMDDVGHADNLIMCLFIFCVICSMQLAHGADPTLKNQEGQTPLDLTMVSVRIYILWSFTV